MIVQFLTRRLDHQIQTNQPITVIHSPAQVNLSHLLHKRSGNAITRDILEYNDWFVLGHDIETRFGQPSPEGLLLSAFCINDAFGEEEVLVIDNTSVKNSEVFTPEVLKRCLFISHNADFEALWGCATNFLPERYGCTMVNGKRLMSGQEGYRFDLISEINRRLGYKYIPPYMDKDIRHTFRDCTYFIGDQILYNAADAIRLKSLYYAQLDQAAEYGQSFLLKSINSRIIIPIAQAEYRGMLHDSQKWIAIAKDRKQRADAICQKLDTLLQSTYGIDPSEINPELRKKKESLAKRLVRNEERKQKLGLQLRRLEEANKTHLKSYRVSLEQYDKLNTTEELVETVSGSINWGSQKQVIEVFKQIGCPIPQAKDQKTKKIKDGVGKEARANWFVRYPNSPYIPILKEFDAMKKIVHNVTSFGEQWVADYVNPTTSRIHTRLDQAGADNGRFSSGSKSKKEKLYPNMQQIPTKDGKEYRECFIADPGRKMLTADYNNCEGIIMISQSGDLNMKRITEMPDSHSYLGTKCWRNIYQRRFDKTRDQQWAELASTYEMNKSTPVKEAERTKFKNSGGLFPVAYGVFASKVAGAAGINEDEGQVMIDTIKAEIPLVIKYLDSVSAFALKNGFVIHNKRTGSRRWFQAVLNEKHYGWKLDKGDIISIESAARNSVISGTNSDIVKEAIALLNMWCKIYKQDCYFMLTVHDELVCDCPDGAEEFYMGKLIAIMERAAKNYLIPEIDMHVECKTGNSWQK